jgi:hypothetical protein
MPKPMPLVEPVTNAVLPANNLSDMANPIHYDVVMAIFLYSVASIGLHMGRRLSG